MKYAKLALATYLAMWAVPLALWAVGAFADGSVGSGLILSAGLVAVVAGVSLIVRYRDRRWFNVRRSNQVLD
jgi:hypothetical protein